ncbi:MAG: carbohydrate-binding family 9-like protein, partial [Lentisphaerae bacterium]|nr:carbohydrate-binding family 9-like protein [Lentisphaerota bacterium]
MRRGMSSFCLMWGFAAAALAAPSPAPRTATVQALAGGVILDGVLDEAAWGAAPELSGFTVVGHRGDSRHAFKTADVQTRFKVLQDAHALYVGVLCDEPNLDGLKAKTPWRDGAVWQDDCIEIFFDPANDGRYYHQVMVNSRGTIYDSYSADYGLVHSKLWNGAFEAAGSVDREHGRWSVEVKIPFGAIVLGEDAGALWKWNITRERHADGALELTTWSPMTNSFHQPRLFGTLSGVSADYAPFRFELSEPSVDVSRAASGTSTLTMGLSVTNRTDRDRRCFMEAAVFGKGDGAVVTEPLLFVVGEPTTVPLPQVSTRGSAVRTDVVFTLRDASTKRVLKAAVRNVSSAYRPVTITMVRPCYRDSIYATESLTDVSFRVGLSAETRRGAERVHCSLTDQDGRVVGQREFPVQALDVLLTIPIPAIPVGDYRLSVRVVGPHEAGKGKAERILHKLPPPESGNEVRIDEHRRVLINGKPFLGIGWYGSVPVNDPRADVVALQNVQTPTVVKVPDTGPIRDAFEKHGIYTIASVENGHLYYSFDLWKQGKRELGKTIREERHKATEPGPELRDLVQQLVECVRHEPGLLGYYIADEPEIHDIPSSYLEHFYEYLCELDPYHPVFVTNDTIDGIVTHGYKCADIIDPDP